MKARTTFYGFFIVAAGFAASMGYLYYSQRGSADRDPIFGQTVSGAAPQVPAPDPGRPVSTTGGRVLIAYAGDLQGDLDPCNCTEPPTGGLPRRLTALRDYRALHPDLPMLAVEIGHAFRHSEKLDDPSNRHMVEAFDLVGVQAVNVDAGDLRRLSSLAAGGWDTSRIKGTFVASAIQPGPAMRFPVKPWTVQTARADSGGREVKVGILALSEASGENADLGQALDIDSAIRRYLPEVEKRSDIVVLLAWLSEKRLLEIAGQFPGIDVMIRGSAVGEGREFPKVGRTVIVESARRGLGVGILQLDFDSGGRVAGHANQIIPLPPMVADAPRLVEFGAQARREYVAWRERDARRQPPLTVPRLYLGSEACKDCHEKAYRAWAASGHARAGESLKKRSSEFNDVCLSCHVTAFEAERGFADMIRTPELSGVHCEACHGSSVDHSRDPQKVHPGLGAFQQLRRKITRQFCLRCHDRENSPRFNYEAYWKKIAH
jgi:hypothetical protein